MSPANYVSISVKCLIFDLIMSTATGNGDQQDVTGGKLVLSVCLTIGLIIIIVVTTFLAHTRGPIITVTISAAHPGTHEERRHRGIPNYLLQAIPVIKYSTRPQPNDEELAVNTRNSEVYSDLPGGEIPMKACGSKPTHANPKASVTIRAGEQGKGKMFENPDMPEYNAMLSLKTRSKHEPLGCSVCKEDFSESDDVRILPCGHTHHQHCIDPWILDFAGTCPLW